VNRAFSFLVAALIALNGLQGQASNLYCVYNRIGDRALQKHHIVMSQVMYTRALEQAETFGDGDSRLVISLVRLANLCSRENEYIVARPLYERMVGIAERHPEYGEQIASGLDQYADLQVRTHRSESASSTRQLAAILHNSVQTGQSALVPSM
jgi:hypothetical protein